MAVIPVAVYQGIADDYDISREQMLRSSSSISDSVQRIVDLTGDDARQPEVDLLNVFNGVSLSTRDTFTSSASYLSSVRAINNHVIVEGGFSDLDDYAANGDSAPFTYPYFWAKLCDDAGFSISDGNIDPPPSDYNESTNIFS